MIKKKTVFGIKSERKKLTCLGLCLYFVFLSSTLFFSLYFRANAPTTALGLPGDIRRAMLLLICARNDGRGICNHFLVARPYHNPVARTYHNPVGVSFLGKEDDGTDDVHNICILRELVASGSSPIRGFPSYRA